MSKRILVGAGLCLVLAKAAFGQPAGSVETVVVTSARLELLGRATTSSQGVISKDELALLPAFRPAQLLETVPGLIVASHSGEGKANQYMLRGVDLDHGTDLATFVDGMPVNEPTHAHGQGYTDLNFLIPEIAAGMDYTKGPYFAAQGDFSPVGSVSMRLANRLGDQVSLTAGTLGFQRLFGAGTVDVGDDVLVGAGELVHYDGPWTVPTDQRKINLMLRYVHGDASDGVTVTGLFYRGLWNATTDQPERALTRGLIARFGTLDPTDGGRALRASLSALWSQDVGMGHLQTNFYGIGNHLTLWNNFTHFLDDPIHGDQEGQNEDRLTLGGGTRYSVAWNIGGLDNDLAAGASLRFDQNHVFRDHTRARQILSAAEDDHFGLWNAGFYAEAVSHWREWLRTVVGLREDVISGHDRGSNPGSASDSLFQPKASVIFGPWSATEFYVSAGQGFHSDDLRGVNQAAAQGIDGAPLIAKEMGEEMGLRSALMPSLTFTLSAFYLKSQSETTYDPDVGQDGAGPGSCRQGLEFNATWQASSWLEFYAGFAASKARYAEPSDDGAGGHIGTHIPDAPTMTASLTAYVKELGPWSGALSYRYLGGFPLTPDNAIKDSGYGEWNIDAAYSFDAWKIGLGLYNILDKRANAAAFYYADRLPGEPAGGVSDIHVHPLEPRSVRLTVTRAF